MAIKSRRKTITMAAATGSVSIGLGAAFARLLRLEVKGDDAAVNAATTFEIVDADGRKALVAVAIDGGTDDSTVLDTDQGFSTVGVGLDLVNDEGKSMMSTGVLGTDNVGGGPLIARSPVLVSLASGTSTDVFEITLIVEV
jgi:hypothetical protein